MVFVTGTWESPGRVRGRNRPRGLAVRWSQVAGAPRELLPKCHRVPVAPRPAGGVGRGVMDTIAGRTRSTAEGEHRTGEECLDRTGHGAAMLVENGGGTEDDMTWRRAGPKWAVGFARDARAAGASADFPGEASVVDHRVVTTPDPASSRASRAKWAVACMVDVPAHAGNADFVQGAASLVRPGRRRPNGWHEETAETKPAVTYL